MKIIESQMILNAPEIEMALNTCGDLIELFFLRKTAGIQDGSKSVIIILVFAKKLYF